MRVDTEGLASWAGTLADRDAQPYAVLHVDNLGPLTALLSVLKVPGPDGPSWWLKVPREKAETRALVTEYLVARVGALIDAPVCQVAPFELQVAEQNEDELLRASCGGVVFGSRDIAGAKEERELKFLNDDNNSVRHAGIFALYDWCWGADAQWLYDVEADKRVYSHDHAYYLAGRPYWEVNTLLGAVGEPREANWPLSGVDSQAFDEYADRLEAVCRTDLQEILASVPREWIVGNHELEVVGWFLEARRAGVAHRLRRLAARVGYGGGL